MKRYLMQNTARTSWGLAIALLVVSPALAGDDLDWVQAMREVHAKGQGEKGVFVQFGDSITYSLAYFAPLQYVDKSELPPDVQEGLKVVDAHMQEACYRWKGPEKGNYSGQTAAWGLKNVDKWIATLKPETALIMFGTNDIRRGGIEAHEKNLRALIQKCLDEGVVVILSTIPPMHGMEAKVQRAVEVQRQVAADLNVPLIDFHAHIINRRPNDWDGALPRFQGHDQWEVPTLISSDGVHPSNPRQWKNDYTEQGLCRNGNVLRSYLTLMAYAEVINVVIKGGEPSVIGRKILGASPPKPAKLPDIDTLERETGDNSQLIAPPMQHWYPQAPPLPEPTGRVIVAETVNELYAAAENVKPGGTILVADGFYRMPRTFHLKTDNVTLRGRNGERTAVVLDFSACRHHEGIAISYCSGVTIADLTVQNVRQNGIKINSNHDVDKVRIYNVLSQNVWQRHVKGPRVPDKNGKADFVEGCRVEYCFFYNDRRKQRGDEPWEDSNPAMGFNYIGGIDIMSARGWVISDNVFTGIRGKTGEARGAVFMWHNSTDCVIERNHIIDCDSGICMGNSSARGPRRHANEFIVRNNFVVRCSESNILADHTRNCKILNNSVHDPESPTGRLLRVVHANDGLVVANNLFSGPRIVAQNYQGRVELRNNLIRSVGHYFVNAADGNLHLTPDASGAIDQATVDPEVREDVDGQPRGERPDLGADELDLPAAAKNPPD
ncbi:MAG: GDSL-type esterase/lipase family protein [Planctomycetota bacterium]